MKNSDRLIKHIKTYGKDRTWGELAELYNIKPDSNPETRRKCANDIWRFYKYKTEKIEKINNEIPSNAKLKSVWGKEGNLQKSYIIDTKIEDYEKKMDFIKTSFIEDAKKYAPRYNKINYKQFGEEKLLEISIYDHHFSKLCWGEETDEDYDIKIATDRFRGAVQYFTDLAKTLSVNKILFVVGQDLFNTDGATNATTNGTIQDVDIRWAKAFTIVRRIIIESVDKFREVCPVDIIVIPGNHDRSQCYYLGEALECWYHNCSEVNVNNSPKLRKYYRYGTNLLGYTHGNEEKITDLPMIMATEASKDFAETTCREFKLGHWHQNRVQEQFGVITRILPSLTGTDFWHKSKGYVGNMKSAQAYLYSKKDGFIAFFQYNI